MSGDYLINNAPRINPVAPLANKPKAAAEPVARYATDTLKLTVGNIQSLTQAAASSAPSLLARLYSAVSELKDLPEKWMAGLSPYLKTAYDAIFTSMNSVMTQLQLRMEAHEERQRDEERQVQKELERKMMDRKEIEKTLKTKALSQSELARFQDQYVTLRSLKDAADRLEEGQFDHEDVTAQRIESLAKAVVQENADLAAIKTEADRMARTP